jgi:hypothetical protein
MPYLLLLLVFGVCFGSPSASAQATNVEHAPKLVCDQATFNFGELDNSGAAEHTYVLRNEGDLTLEIKNVRPSCGCTVASISTKTVPPGGQTEVSARFSLQGRTGFQHKTIAVESNDPKQPSFTLVLEGTAISDLDVKPRQLSFGRITSDACVTGVVEISVQTTNAVRITKVTTASSNIAVKTETIEEGKRYRILIESLPPLAQGAFAGNARIETDHPKYPVIDIPVTAFVAKDLVYLPTDLTLVQSPQPVTRYVVVRSDTGRKFQVQAVEPPVPSIQANIIPMNESGYRIELTNIVATAELNGKVLRIKTTLEGNDEIQIPLRVIANPTPPNPSPNP